jgi:toxin-antitoxin system PIN domain toxin
VILADVNVLVYAARREAPRHQAARQALAGAVALCPHTVNGTLRILTHPAIWKPPLTMAEALTFVEALVLRPGNRWLAPGPRHWALFADLCRRHASQGNAVYDLHLAALAIEHGCPLVSADEDFRPIAGLRLQPL